MSQRAARRLLIVGWDAADWQVIDPLLVRGSMPNLKRLIEAGVRAELRTMEPKLSPILWSTIATGKTADKHGILNFVEPNPSGPGVRVVSSTTRRTKALWNILTQAGMRIHTVSWYASHPVEPINGCAVSNLFREGMPKGSAEPWPLHENSVRGTAALKERIAALRKHPAELGSDGLQGLVPQLAHAGRDDKRPAELAGKWSQALAVHAAATEILAEDRASGADWDCMMVFHESIDTIGHTFMELRPPRMEHVSKADTKLYGEVMDRVYLRHDELLGQLLAAAGPDTTVILLSDHGFYSGADRPVAETWRHESGAVAEARWHRPEGMIVLSGPGIKRGETIAAPCVIDITPTALALLGLPVGTDMDGRVVAEAFASAPAIKTVESWETQPGEAGMHPAEMQQDPFEAADALKQLVELGYMPEMGADHERMLSVTRRETRWNLAMALMTTNRQAKAVAIFQELAGEVPSEPRYVIPLAQCQQAVGDALGCASTLRAFLQAGADSLDARVLLANALAVSGDGSGADEQIARLEREHGARPAMAMALGELMSSRERWSDAERYFEVAQKHEPRNPAVCLAKARVALGQKDYEAAAERCLDAAELHMAYPEAHFLLGVALAWGGDLQSARLSLMHALQMQPGHVDAVQFLAAVEHAAGNKDQGLELERRWRELQAKAQESGLAPPPDRPWGVRAWLARRSTLSQ